MVYDKLKFVAGVGAGWFHTHPSFQVTSQFTEFFRRRSIRRRSVRRRFFHRRSIHRMVNSRHNKSRSKWSGKKYI